MTSNRARTSGKRSSRRSGAPGSWFTSNANNSDEIKKEVVLAGRRHVTVVPDGNFQGQHGSDGKPDSLALNGNIQPDGSVALYAQGLTGDPRFTPGKVPPGSPIAYHIQVKFDGSSGARSRTEQRPCTFTAFKR